MASRELEHQNHGRDEFLQPVQVLHTQFRLFGTFMWNNGNASGSVLCIRKKIFSHHAVVSHVTTCQGRDHIVTAKSGENVLVVLNERLNPDLTLRDLCERLHHISLHWPRYADAHGAIIGDFSICAHTGAGGRTRARARKSC